MFLAFFRSVVVQALSLGDGLADRHGGIAVGGEVEEGRGVWGFRLEKRKERKQ